MRCIIDCRATVVPLHMASIPGDKFSLNHSVWDKSDAIRPWDWPTFVLVSELNILRTGSDSRRSGNNQGGCWTDIRGFISVSRRKVEYDLCRRIVSERDVIRARIICDRSQSSQVSYQRHVGLCYVVVYPWLLAGFDSTNRLSTATLRHNLQSCSDSTPWPCLWLLVLHMLSYQRLWSLLAWNHCRLDVRHSSSLGFWRFSSNICRCKRCIFHATMPLKPSIPTESTQ